MTKSYEGLPVYRKLTRQEKFYVARLLTKTKELEALLDRMPMVAKELKDLRAANFRERYKSHAENMAQEAARWAIAGIYGPDPEIYEVYKDAAPAVS